MAEFLVTDGIFNKTAIGGDAVGCVATWPSQAVDCLVVTERNFPETEALAAAPGPATLRSNH